jgi:hypothetical protein
VAINIKHGHTHRNPKTGKVTYSKTYNSWRNMRERCRNKNHEKYPLYGGRGIKVCDRWINSFCNFLADMGERPEKHTIDRINANSDYEPSNCKWSTYKEQNKNRIKRNVK